MIKFGKIFFIVFIFGMLLVPLSHINQATESRFENRTLSKFPRFRKHRKINADYDTEFESWLGDRFFGRKRLITKRAKWLYILNGHTENHLALMADNGMMFNKSRIKTVCTPVKGKKLADIEYNLKKFQDWCRQHHIKWYMFIAPEKEDVYLDTFQNLPKDCQKDTVARFVEDIKRDLGIDILYTIDLYKQPHDIYTHFHTDHHWTEFGAFLTYQKVAERIRKDFKNFGTVALTDFDVEYNVKPRYASFKNLYDRGFHRGSNCQKLSLIGKDCPLTHPYAYYNHKDKKNLQPDYGPLNMARRTKFLKAKNNLKVVLLGQSHGGFFMPFLPYAVKEVLMLRMNNEEKGVTNVHDMKRFEQHILDFKPDIVLLYSTSASLNDLRELYKVPEE